MNKVTSIGPCETDSSRHGRSTRVLREIHRLLASLATLCVPSHLCLPSHEQQLRTTGTNKQQLPLQPVPTLAPQTPRCFSFLPFVPVAYICPSLSGPWQESNQKDDKHKGCRGDDAQNDRLHVHPLRNVSKGCGAYDTVRLGQAEGGWAFTNRAGHLRHLRHKVHNPLR